MTAGTMPILIGRIAGFSQNSRADSGEIPRSVPERPFEAEYRKLYFDTGAGLLPRHSRSDAQARSRFAHHVRQPTILLLDRRRSECLHKLELPAALMRAIERENAERYSRAGRPEADVCGDALRQPRPYRWRRRTAIPQTATRTYRAGVATLAGLRQRAAPHGVGRFVIVQPSFTERTTPSFLRASTRSAIGPRRRW